jgi:hypothetical protein
MKTLHPNPNERYPLVDSEAFKQQGRSHPMFGKPVNDSDLFHAAKKDAVPSIMQDGFSDDYLKSSGYFGAGAYFHDDPGLSMSFVDSSPSHLFVCSVVLGVTNDEHYLRPLTSALGADFRPPHGVDSIKGRISYGGMLRQAEYIVYKSGTCKATYLLRFDH